MGKRRFDGDVAESGEIAFEKRTAGCGEDDALNLHVVAATKRLMHRVVLGVDWENFAAVLARGTRDHVPGSDKNFFVGDPDAFARLERSVHGRNADGTDVASHYDIGIVQR